MTDLPVQKRTRARAPRVHTGCTTCKIRHLKCGEEKPSCRRCSSTGFKCDGYKPFRRAKPQNIAVRSTSVDTVAPLAAQKRLLPNLGSYELKLYQRYVAPGLSSHSDAGFWNVLIPQMSHTEPVIRHAVAAICAVNRDIESIRGDSSPKVVRPNPLAIKEVSQAMARLSQRINSDPCSNLVALVACLLFTCLELFCGNFEIAIVHVTSGFKILNGLGSVVPAGKSHQPIADVTTIEEEVAPVFRHLSVLCLLFGQTDAFDATGHVAKIEFATFISLESARLNLFELFCQIFHFINVASNKANEGNIDVADIIEKVKLERRLKQWHSCLEQYVKTAVKLGHHVDENAVNLLRLHYHTILIWLSVSLSVDGAELNLHTSNFEEILRLSENLVQDSPSKRNAAGPITTSPSQKQGYNKFSFGMGMIPSLYWVGRACRDSTIRKKALNLLLKAPLQESLWDAYIYSKLAERALAIEEPQRYSQKPLSPVDCLRGDLLLSSDHKADFDLPEHHYKHVRIYGDHSSLNSNNHSSD